MTPEQLTKELAGALGKDLISVILFGSASAGDQTKYYSNFNILVVMESLDLSLLEKVSPLVRKWRTKTNPTPLFLTEHTIKSSLDVFPIEYLDMKDSHRVLYGPDPFESGTISPANLRHQLEFELRSKLIQLERIFMESEGKEAVLREVVLKSVSSLSTLFNAALRLAGEKPASKKRDIWSTLNTRVPVDMIALDEILNLRDGRKSSVPIRDLFSRLHKSVQRVIEFVDQSH